MNEKFSNYVKSTAFNLSLSSRQIDTLYELVHDLRNYNNNSFVTHVRALERRGLTKHNTYPDREKELYAKRQGHLVYTGLTSGDYPAYTVTTEGNLVYQLLYCAGYFDANYGELK